MFLKCFLQFNNSTDGNGQNMQSIVNCKDGTTRFYILNNIEIVSLQETFLLFSRNS